MTPAIASVFVPATIGNVGPGFDVLGLAVGGLGDRITVELLDPSEPSRIAAVTGRDANMIPLSIGANCTSIAALSLLRRLGDHRNVAISIDRRLPISGGLGGSAAASVGGALAALYASGKNASSDVIFLAALDGEGTVAGRHLDNIAPALFGGLCVCRSSEPPDAARAVVRGDWWLTVVTSSQKLSTKTARQVLPELVSRQDMVRQIAHTAGVLTAFATGDYELLRRSLIDHFAEPRRAPLIQNFRDVHAAAVRAGALACSISGAGPTIFAVSATEAVAHGCRAAMVSAFQPLAAEGHVGPIAVEGAHPV